MIRSKKTLVNNAGHELIAISIQQALHSLGEVTWEVSIEDLLENIFSRFCIGK